ncbi:MAG: Na+/H+ antiporter subunit E [Chromatiales bacterium]|nr:Na+/H+ antiporter subunit E [Chromatiales bacterium]
MILYLSALLFSLYGFWLLLSGFWHDSLLLGLGGVSVLLVAVLAARIERRDPEHHYLSLLVQLGAYWFWLLRKILVANRDVVLAIWRPQRYPISPTEIRLASSQRTPTGRTIFANSITLTPGTVAMEVDDEGIVVHALQTQAAQDLARGEMDRRVSRLERSAK